METLVVNLDLPPEERWQHLKNYKGDIEELMAYYLKDFEGAELIFEIVDQYKEVLIPAHYLAEIGSIAEMCTFNTKEVLVANLYYDVLKSYFGCTAFAIAIEHTVLHARNLDWHTENNLLGKHSTIFDFQKAGKTIFKSVGWKGFIGVLSGIKPQKFSVTLNAVLSQDAPELAYPVSLLIRDILESVTSYQEAKTSFLEKEIASDCLLLLSGIKPDEMTVIERTPKRSAARQKEKNHIVVTNDYKELLDQNVSSHDSILSATSCGRYDRAKLLLQTKSVQNLNDCMQILSDEQVKMGITVQQMVFDNRSGEILARKVIV